MIIVFIVVTAFFFSFLLIHMSVNLWFDSDWLLHAKADEAVLFADNSLPFNHSLIIVLTPSFKSSNMLYSFSITRSLLILVYSTHENSSPVYLHIFFTSSKARPSPHKCISLACSPSRDIVHAPPRSESPKFNNKRLLSDTFYISLTHLVAVFHRSLRNQRECQSFNLQSRLCKNKMATLNQVTSPIL